MKETILIIFTAFCSGIVATIITILWQKQNQLNKEKVKIFKTLMSKRYDIAAEESVEALNMIDVVFYNSEKVRSAWKDFNDATRLPESDAKEQTINDKHLRLLEVIARNIGYKKINWEDIKQFYYPVGLSNRKQDEAILRKLQIDAALSQINETKENANSSQIN